MVRLDFEEGAKPPASAQYDLLVTQKAGIRAVAGPAGRGRALQFPRPCRSADRSTCAKAMVEVPDEANLSPGRRDFRYGLAVKLAADATTTGSNLMQKGFARGRQGQWKLQIDDLAGRPSCVLVGRGSDDIHQVMSIVAVADGLWHTVSCVRQASSLMITVDGAEQGRTSLPAGLFILNAAPMRLGAKSLRPDNDQFFGALDVVMEVATDA